MQTHSFIDTASAVGKVASSALESKTVAKVTGGVKRLFSSDAGLNPWRMAAWIGGAVTAIGAGAAGMYFLDPQNGRQRRARLAQSAHRAKLRSSQSARQLSHKVTERFTHRGEKGPQLAESAETDGASMYDIYDAD